MSSGPPSNVTFRQWAPVVLLIAIILCLGPIIAALINRNQHADKQQDFKLGIEVEHDQPNGPVLNPQKGLSASIKGVEAVEQPVNRYFRSPDSTMKPDLWKNIEKGVEHATFRFVVANESDTDLQIDGGAVLIGEMHKVDLGTPSVTVMTVGLIDHAGHARVPFDRPKMGDKVPIRKALTIAAHTAKEIFVWFRSTDRHASPVVLFDARLQLNSAGGSIRSDPFRVEIHTDETQFVPNPNELEEEWDWESGILN